MIEVLKFFLVKNLVHLAEDWSILLLQDILIDFELLLTKQQALMLLVYLVNQCSHKLLQLAMELLHLHLLWLVLWVASSLV